MKRRLILRASLVIGVSLIAGVIGGVTVFTLSQMQPKNDQAQSGSSKSGPSQEINTLMVERRDVLAKLVGVLRNRYQQGLMQVDAVYRAQNELLSAELELAKTREDRLGALNSQLTNFQSLEQRALELQKVGARGGEAEVALSATAGRLQAEIQILRELAADK